MAVGDYVEILQQLQRVRGSLMPLGNPSGWAATADTVADPAFTSLRARELFISHMSGATEFFRVKADDFLYCHAANDTVYMFYLFDGKGGMVSEPLDVFPSELLVTQFRMILA
jgi:hypothetical protein